MPAAILKAEENRPKLRVVSRDWSRAAREVDLLDERYQQTGPPAASCSSSIPERSLPSAAYVKAGRRWRSQSMASRAARLSGDPTLA
jgi:hypothetical protein